MSDPYPSHLTHAELQAETGTLLPDKEVLSILDLILNLDLFLDLAAPIDLAVAANANIAAPIAAAAGANILSPLSTATAVADQGVVLDQAISGQAIAHAPQTSVIDQSDQPASGGSGGSGSGGGTGSGSGGGTGSTPTDPAALLGGGSLLNVDVNLGVDADIAAPIAGAVAANANVAAPIDAAVAANIASIGSQATAVASQDAVISQNLNDVVASATAEQDSTINQGTGTNP